MSILVKQFSMRLVLSFLMTTVSISIYAETTKIYPFTFNYNVESKTAEVTDYSGWLDQEVIIPESINVNGYLYNVTSIGVNAFNQAVLRSICIPNSIINIGMDAFYGCNLSEVHISDLTAWCNIEFKNNFSNPLNKGAGLYIEDNLITECEIPTDIQVIKDFAFTGCNSFNSVKISDSVTKICMDAFSYCNGLESITIGKSVTEINCWAFEESTRISNVRFLGNEPPANMSFMDEFNESCIIYVPSEALEVYDLAIINRNPVGFENQIKLEYDSHPGSRIEALSSKDRCQVTTLVIRGLICGSDFVAMQKLSNLITLDLTNATIEERHCTTENGEQHLAESNVFGRYFLDNKNKLQTLILPKTLEKIESQSFENCKSLHTVIIDNSVKEIGSWAFAGCHNLKSISIGTSVTTIGGSAFYGCTSLNSIVIPESVKEIGSSAFSGCPLKTIKIPNSITEIRKRTFESCSALKEVVIGNSVTSIGYHAFNYCPNLTKITIPKSLTSIEEEAFLWCNRDAEVHISDLSAWCNINFADKYSTPGNYNLYLENELIIDCTVPDDVQHLKDYAFYNCIGFRSLIIGKYLNSIGQYAIPSYGLQVIKSVNPVPPIVNNKTFSNYDAQLLVPLECKATYKKDDIWGKFFNIEECDFADIVDISRDISINPYDIDYYTLQGIKVATQHSGGNPISLPAGIYIARCGNKTQKVVFR